MSVYVCACLWSCLRVFREWMCVKKLNLRAYSWNRGRRFGCKGKTETQCRLSASGPALTSKDLHFAIDDLACCCSPRVYWGQSGELRLTGPPARQYDILQQQLHKIVNLGVRSGVYALLPPCPARFLFTTPQCDANFSRFVFALKSRGRTRKPNLLDFS